MPTTGATTLLLALSLLGAGQVRAQAAPGRASWGDSGIVVRFPRSMSPDSISREMRVADRFSGYEWRVIFMDGDRALLSALVVAPDDSLALHRIATIEAAYKVGDLRQCARDQQVLACDRPARGLVRDINGQLEIGIVDSRWLTAVLGAREPKVRLMVKRNREDLWSEEYPLIAH
jgi:hypothetical protein